MSIKNFSGDTIYEEMKDERMHLTDSNMHFE